MRVLTLDCDLGTGDDSFEFGSPVSLYDYDVVFWDPQNSVDNYSLHKTVYRGRASLSSNESARLLNDVVRRRSEFKEFVEMGRCLVVFLPGDVSVYVDTGEREYSGTGRNRKETRIVKDMDITSAVPLKFTRALGSGIEILPASDEISSFFRQTAGSWSYRCVIEEPGEERRIKPLLYVKDTKKIVGGVVTTKAGGRVVLLPDFLPPEETHDEDGDSSPGIQLQDWIEGLLLEPDSSLPSWAIDLQFPTEVPRAKQQFELEKQMASVVAQLDGLSAEQALDERWKTLITGHGRSLERRVLDAFEVFGFEMDEGRPGRTDLRGKHGEHSVVIEVKGLTKSAAEKHAAQLEKWVSDELVEGVSAKGILVANTWRDLPLSDRSEQDFPDQMLFYCEQRNHCLVTGLQLLAMVRACLDDPSRADEVAELLKTNIGPIAGWNDIGTIFVAPEPPAELATKDVEPEVAEEIGD